MKLVFEEDFNNMAVHKRFDVKNSKDELLGCIYWNSPWKCYVWEQYTFIMMSSDCLMQVVSKLDELEGKKRLIP